MATATLVFYKAARTTAHLNENLRLLAANEGQRVTTSYASRWLTDEAQTRPPEPGEVALVALALYPYEQFLPCRIATVRDVAVESAYRQFSLEVGPFVAVGEQERVLHLLADTPADQRPRQAFLARSDGFDVTVASGPAENDEAWDALTASLLGHGEYNDAMFARVSSSHVEMSLDMPSHIAIHTAGARTDPGVRLEAEDGELTLAAWEHANGVTTLEIIPRTAGRLLGHVRLTAHGQQSAPVTIDAVVDAPVLIAREESAAQVPAEVIDPVLEPGDVIITSTPALILESVPLRRSDVRRLLLDLDRREVDDPGLQLAELAAEAAPDDPEIAAAAGSFLARADRYDEAAALLLSFDPGDLPARTVYLRFLAACKSGHMDDAKDLMRRLDFATDEHFEFLTDAIESLPDATAIELGYQLMAAVLDVHRGLELYEQMRPRLRQPSDVKRYAEHLWTNVAEQEGIDLLVEHTAAAPDRHLLELLVDYAAATEGNQDIGPQLVAETRLRIERGELDRLLELVEMSKLDARFPQHLEVIQLVSAALGASREHRVNAVSMLCDESDAARASGRVREAADLATRAAAIAAGDEAARLVAADAVEAARVALAQTEPLASLLARDREALIEALRTKIGGTTLRIVGGKRDDEVASQLRTLVGFRKIDWTESEKHQRTNIDWVSTVDPSQTVVVVLTDAIGHATSIPLKERCQIRGIRHVEATRGVDAIVDSLLVGGAA